MQTDFEGSTSLPSGWTQSQVSGNATWSIQTGGGTGGGTPSAAYGGTKNATLYVTNTNENKTRLISPTFNTVGYTSRTLTFWHTQALWSPDQDELRVFFSSDGGSTWSLIATYTSNVATWTQRTINLSTASANSRIAFEGNARYGHGVCLDNIKVTAVPTTFSEVSVSATDITASEAGQDPGRWTITRIGKTSDAISVNYTMTGTATSGSDYTVSLASPISFAAGETSKVVTLTPVDDAVAGENSEVVTLTLTAGTGYVVEQASANISIMDDEGLNILILGSTHSFSEGEIGGIGVVHEKPFNPTTIATRLQSILSQDPLNSETIQVAFEDIYKDKTVDTAVGSGGGIQPKNYRCYSLMQHFMWPDGKAARLANLRGEGGVDWDYIILCEDAYVMAHFPGMFAEAVEMIRNEVGQSPSPAQIMLLAQWPESGSTFTAAAFNEIAHRIGDSAGLTVVPAGKAWDGYGSKDTDTAHPTPKGQYLAAAAIYSKLFNRSASTSGYAYPSDGTNIANHAHTVVQANAGVAQYSGLYSTANAFQMKYSTPEPIQMKYCRKRQIDWNEYGTSTEDGFANGLIAATAATKINNLKRTPPAEGNPVDLSFSRGSDAFEADKQYQVDTKRHDRVHGFPMGDHSATGEVSMIYGIDKRYETNGAFENGTDLGVAYSMVREGQVPDNVRGIPVRLLWSKIDHSRPEIPGYSDTWHMGDGINWAVGSYMYTLLSGRCPVDAEPPSTSTTDWRRWYSRKLGYETAWRMAHLSTRAPGFRVQPSSSYVKMITATDTETMTVQFVYPPLSDVTVNISVSNPTAASVNPATLTFTPSNYNTLQTITVTGIAANTGLQNVDVNFTTSSSDKSYHGLEDSWGYVSNTQPVSYGQSVLLAGFDGTNFANTTNGAAAVYKELTIPRQSSTAAGNVSATLSTTDAVVNGLQWAGMTSPATWGTASLLPNPTTTTNLVFAADNAATVSFLIQNTGTRDVTVEKLHFYLKKDSTTGGSASQMTIALAGGDLSSSGTGVQTLVNTTTATNYDFNLSSILTDATLSPGQSATFTLNVTPVDPVGTNRRVRIDNLAISGTVNPMNNFTNWMDGFNLGGQTAFSDDFDKDGLKNGVESWFGTHPGQITAGVAPGAVDTGSGTFIFSHPLNENPPADVTGVYRWSKDLTNFYLSGQTDPGGTTVIFTPGTPSNGMVTVTATITGTSTDKIFMDIEVTKN